MTALLLPTLVSAVAVFVLSSLVHMVLPWHKSDYPRLANEDALLDALRALNLPSGDYCAPRPKNMADMKTPEYQEKLRRGPVVAITVAPKGYNGSMGKALGSWFVYSLVISFLAGHVALSALGTAGDDHLIFHTVALAAFLGYAGALAQMSIWYWRGWGLTLKSMFDGLLYALATGFIFAWMWPQA
jgi:hypothetical protein